MGQRLIIWGLSVWLALIYIHNAKAETLTFFTENYPPYNYENPQNHKLEGISVDIVRELMDRTGFSYVVKLTPWKRGYELTLSQDNTCLFTTGRTPERETLFQWITPLTDNPLVLFAPKGRPIAISKLEEARRYRIGGYLGDATVDYLVSNKIPVETVHDDKLNIKKLTNGRIDLWATGYLAGKALAREMGNIDLKRVFILMSLPGGIACNLHVSAIVINRMQQELQTLYKEGFVERIYNKYDPSLPVPRMTNN